MPPPTRAGPRLVTSSALAAGRTALAEVGVGRLRNDELLRGWLCLSDGEVAGLCERKMV